VLAFLLLVGSHAAVAADNGGRLMVQLAPDMIHFDPSPEHTKYSWLVGLEWIRDDDWLAGYSYFNNSFNQKSHYAYGGRVWPLGERNSPHWYFKLTGGLLIGYREPYEDKIPINSNGIGLGVIPGLGWQHGRFNVQMELLGAAGMMFTVGYDLFP
jgi:hypothetical protein